ncbi:maestro heat-like repeat family member 5 [Anas platyrhynchos]|uniref:maestro heat-like repeat family member 5 n=1 Tax=Anas platyrhynchos TaxID=8839 RepID=UPI003AF2E97E
MDALDTMLEGFVRNCPIASFNTEMQNMLKVMLDFAVSKNSAVRESAVKVIERLITFIRWYLVIKILGNFENYGNDEPTDFNLRIPILGKLWEKKKLQGALQALPGSHCSFLQMLAQNESYEFGNPVHLQSYLRHPSPEMRFLVLKGLCTVSESPEKAREIQVLLPDILEALQDTNTDVVLKALLVLKNVMAHVERRKASGPALQLAEKLLPFFDHESSHMREHSICLFQTVVEAVLRQRKKEMKRTVHRSLLPLYFHMRDQSESVAKASGEALAVTAEFLRCKELKRLAQTEQTWRIGECLLQQDRGRVEEYLQQSQPYLHATQTDLRLEAVRFIGEPSPWVPLGAAFGSPRHCPVAPRAPRLGPCSRVQEGAQPGWPGQGLRCWERAGEWGSDGVSVSSPPAFI